MCTVTIIPHGQGIRLACNRDESRARPIALPPRLVTAGARRTLMPIDPQSGGTWIAANDAGLIGTLLNAYAGPKADPARVPKLSRGTIIPALMETASLEDAFARLQSLDMNDFAAFRLVLADRRSCAEVRWTGEERLQTPPTPRAGPMLFTSSGLGDALVESPRRALFDEFFAAGQYLRERQDAYHRHFWPERRHLSVCMSRPEARTVSLTIVEIDDTSVRMTYYPDAPDQPMTPVVAVLKLAA
jgi:hypothetical protein